MAALTTATRRIQFCAGHRVMEHESKCAHLHGHNYVALFHARTMSGSLDSVGRVIDFGVLKERIGAWIDEHWDHGFIIYEEDTEARDAVLGFEPRVGVRQKVHVLNRNPTAENMAAYLLYIVCPEVLRGTGVEVYRVTLWETENCSAEVELR